MFHVKYNQNVKEGSKLEGQLFEQIKKYFNDPELTQTGRYHKFDFISSHHLIELKQIKSSFGLFPLFMVSNLKLQYARKLKQKNKKLRIYFIFKYNDCIKLFEYTGQKPDDKKYFGRSDRGKKECKQLYYYFNNNLLRTIEL